MENVLAILLAGGAGERLYPLTKDTAKPAVPFGGAYRIIDFTLSNCINSNVRRILILTQYKSLDLIRHIRDGWNIFSAEMGEYIEVLPPMKRVHEDWYQGTADAVFQNFQSIEAENPDAVILLSGDGSGERTEGNGDAEDNQCKHRQRPRDDGTMIDVPALNDMQHRG